MEPSKNNFLDKNSLLAIVLLGFCWLIWDAHMKKKYPNTTKKNVVKEQKVQESIKKPDKKIKTNFSKTKEILYKYSGEKIDIIFSSRGFGVSRFKLKGFFNRQGEPIVFKNSKQPLFATQLLETEETIPFKIKKMGKTYRGTFATKDFRLIKTINIDEERFVLDTTIEITPKKVALKGLRTVFSQSFPKEKDQSGFVKLLTAYGQNIFKGFVFFEDKTNLFTKEDIKEENTYPHFSVGSLGDKYFGAAFINKSSLLPTLRVKKQEKEAVAKADYIFLNKKPITLKYLSFLGPKSSDNLKNLHQEAKSWIDFGFFSWLAHPLLFVLKNLYKVMHNWGFSIVLLTFLIRLCLFPVNVKSYKSMKIMQTIQPEIKKLREEHKKDPKKLNEEIMALMKENKASPFGGCLPLFLQTPVFFALYRVLGESIELYQAPFILWIQDLSSKDPYYILPVLGGLTLFIQQKITPMNVPAAQARLLTFMPLVFSFFMLSLPSGLTLYIFISGLFGLIQHKFFMGFKKQ